MGRYYNGDIEGKFMVAVQSSDDADFFGVKGEPPQEFLEYYFDKDNLAEIKEGIETCKRILGDWKKKLDDFFKTRSAYNRKMLQDEIGLKDWSMLEWYARLELGEKILKCVEEKGECQFEAEC